MLRLSDRGIPPHMLHLYEGHADASPKPTEMNEDAARLPTAFLKIGAVVAKGVNLMRPQRSDDFLPESAKTAQSQSKETQYLGQTSVRDTRWTASN